MADDKNSMTTYAFKPELPKGWTDLRSAHHLVVTEMKRLQQNPAYKGEIESAGYCVDRGETVPAAKCTAKGQKALTAHIASRFNGAIHTVDCKDAPAITATPPRFEN